MHLIDITNTTPELVEMFSSVCLSTLCITLGVIEGRIVEAVVQNFELDCATAIIITLLRLLMLIIIIYKLVLVQHKKHVCLKNNTLSPFHL